MAKNDPDFWVKKREVHTEGSSPGYNEHAALVAVLSMAQCYGIDVASVLDYGCGYGRFKNLFGKSRYVGFDWALPEGMEAPYVDEVPDESFDLVFFHAVLLHNTAKQLKEIAAWAKTRAKYILIVELFGREWRGNRPGNPLVINRTQVGYEDAFERECLFRVDMSHLIYKESHPDRNNKVSYIWLH